MERCRPYFGSVGRPAHAIASAPKPRDGAAGQRAAPPTRVLRARAAASYVDHPSDEDEDGRAAGEGGAEPANKQGAEAAAARRGAPGGGGAPPWPVVLQARAVPAVVSGLYHEVARIRELLEIEAPAGAAPCAGGAA